MKLAVGRDPSATEARATAQGTERIGTVVGVRGAPLGATLLKYRLVG